MITLWHNPRCSKSRQALALFDEAGAKVRLRLYLKEPPSLAEITALHTALGRPVIDMVRSNERAFKEAGLSAGSSDAELLQAMADHPILIERPIALSADKAVIGRPPEDVLTLV